MKVVGGEELLYLGELGGAKEERRYGGRIQRERYASNGGKYCF